ncbi:hypothetical protein Ae168Ps1_4471c [Pseudonocardia sp. Ae168_Ps1]|nr:hypothetical protein FRP1_20560 [Pseudonocardia sp. EC080625-04]ALL78179.1 hypothetical protein AD006_27980 [Pseudonocardia sp. EC080610-09]ALL81091.1 hypothetical protein AD017_07575 [Pseudonocardia sp. EC080619-01]OLL76066.1 hypothetical protein Ae150APs1_4444c [Pseudonocardia sp. Ae150A_Ps1]OLL82065.1 hypothetical protein Ae168Ps1_4471c [Pseudonocardia sp. Ae168_Ps1]OLL83822.1 hypothetical protein Ae263Ps1_0877 [Pseudonocardia sp. Ae263_Ps1]OLL90139.1 hypothetical protein Ae356Ps1_0036c
MSVRAATVAVAALLVLAGCGTGPATTRTTTGEGTSASDRVGAPGLDALRTKFRFFAEDTCFDGDPAQVFPRCGRFVTEIRNVVGQVRRDAPAAAPQADATEAAVDRFTAGCATDPGTVGGGDPATCGPAFREVQEAVQGMATAVGAPG